MSRDWGHRSLPSCELDFKIAVRRRRFLCLGTNLIPRRGAPSGSATPFSGMAHTQNNNSYSVGRGVRKTRNFLLRKPNKTLTRICRLSLTGDVRLERFGRNRTQPCLLFGSKIRTIPVEAAFIFPSEPMVECPPEDGGCATQWWAEVADAEREPRISYAGRGTSQ